MATFTKFDPRAYLERHGDESRSANPPNPPNPSLAAAPEASALGAFDALGEANTRSVVPSIAAPEYWDDVHDECAAIIEFDAGIPRAWAEGFARLAPSRPPAGVPLERWQAVLDAIGAFLDRWAIEAIAKGWEASDIFGADAARPEVSWLNAGPLWHGDGARVVEVHPDRMIFETRGGVRQSAPRRPHFRPRALPWELER